MHNVLTESNSHIRNRTTGFLEADGEELCFWEYLTSVHDSYGSHCLQAQVSIIVT